MKKTISVIVAGATVFLALLGADHYAKAQANKPFEPTENKHYVQVTKSKDFKDALKTLGVQNGESFEILSYSCPACKNMEPLFDHITSSKQLVMHKFHLGGVNDAAGKSEYIIKKASPENLNDFREKMFAKYLSDSTVDDKNSFAMSIPLSYGITSEQIIDMDNKASEYTKALNTLADAVDLKSTPSLYIGGEYYIMQQNHKTGEQFKQTISHVVGLLDSKIAK
ncbi:hypothetical protein OTK49_01765 [Vibrio coralliirubri]|uniref:hypothetical protein n=1 Tax=Vibrio coralliirubri TaxID=1516159 RepID=UPI002284C72B|nr:hypothetical protein [Vibrio coralliirubri]MCY9861240.1 hypothetical protein [Vibrio coralliirubri]